MKKITLFICVTLIGLDIYCRSISGHGLIEVIFVIHMFIKG
jgi:hypothetical protein